MVHALCGFPRGLVYGGGSPHSGEAEFRSGGRTRSGSRADAIRPDGEALYHEEDPWSRSREAEDVIHPGFVRKAEDGTAIFDFGSEKIHFRHARLRE